MLLDDALRAAELVAGTAGPIVDVGSGGGTPGIPLAVALPDRAVTLLDAERPQVPLPRDLGGRAAESLRRLGPGRGAAPEQFGVAVAKALAHPPTAAEWCLPLVREGGLVVLWVGETAEPERVAAVAARSAASSSRRRQGCSRSARPPRRRRAFPRRTGVAKKRPLA